MRTRRALREKPSATPRASKGVARVGMRAALGVSPSSTRRKDRTQPSALDRRFQLPPARHSGLRSGGYEELVIPAVLRRAAHADDPPTRSAAYVLAVRRRLRDLRAAARRASAHTSTARAPLLVPRAPPALFRPADDERHADAALVQLNLLARSRRGAPLNSQGTVVP